MNSDNNKYISFIRFKTLSLWDVKRYVQKHILFQNAVKLKDVLRPYKEPISKQELISNNWQIISKINFAGDLFLRDRDEINTFKGNLYLVDSDSLIYSKINVRHGCIYYHPSNATPFAVSSEYPVFKIDTQVVSGEYLVKFIQSKMFKSILNNKTTGISKSRVKSDAFLETEVSVPALSVQNDLLHSYYDKIRKADDLEKEANQIEDSIIDYLVMVLGIETKQEKKEKKSKYRFINFINYREVTEWGIEIIKKKQKRESFKYSTVKIKDLCKLGSGGTPSRSRPQYYTGNIPWVKTGEVVNEVIQETEEHITEEAVANSSAKLYPKGSLIIAMYGQGDTRGRTAKLGIDATTNQACAVLHDIDNSIVTTDYLWYYLQGRYEDLRSMASGNNQPNLNAGKINNYNVVVPPINLQNEIVNHINEQKAIAKDLKLKAFSLREQALQEFEHKIFEQL